MKIEKFYIINSQKNYLSSSSWDQQFCSGLKGFSKNGAIGFNTKKEAEDYILKMDKSLEDWINIDIKEQAKNWSEFNRERFLVDSFKQYEKNKKKIKSLKITNLF